MNPFRTSRTLRSSCRYVGLAVGVAWGLPFLSPQAASAHGSLEDPASRTHICRFSDIDSPMCSKAWGENPQALYDWMEVNLGDADGRHAELIPDGQLCSAGRPKYTAFDEPGDWPTSNLTPDADGLYRVTFHATAPHAAESFRFYLSRDGFDPLLQRLAWDDLELVFDSGEIPYTELVSNPHHEFRFALPERSDRALLYFVWQRSDSPEAFYGCSDVVIDGANGSAPPAPIDPGDQNPENEHGPVMPAPGLTDLSVEVNLTDDWGSGACGEGFVTNHGALPSVWEAHVELPGNVTTAWDSSMSLLSHPHTGTVESPEAGTHHWRVVGADWNERLEPGASTSFGFCLDRTGNPVAAEPDPQPEPEPQPEPAPDPEPQPEPGPVPEPVDPGQTEPGMPTPPAAGGPEDPSPIAGGAILAAYFPEWGIYGRNYRIADIPADEITHLVYAFADLDANGDVVLFDSWAAVEKRFSATESVDGIADGWEGTGVFGNFGQLAKLEAAHPSLRSHIAIGGWTLSKHFSDVLATEAGRLHVAASVRDFLERYPVFDGVDFDWEYPGGGGLATNTASNADGENYALFLSSVRQELDALGSQSGRRYDISVASPAGHHQIANFNLPGLAPSVNFFNLMAYDFHGTWENRTGHMAAMWGDPAGYDIETAVEAYLAAGVPSEKIVLGFPLYTRAWKGVTDSGDGGYGAAATGAAPGSFVDSPGIYDYKDLLARTRSGTSGWDLYWDDNAQAAYLFEAATGIWSSFETPGTVALKAGWAQERGLGGMMFWDLSGDAAGDPESLITASHATWVGGRDFETITRDSGISFDFVIGGNGRFDAIAEVPPATPGAEPPAPVPADPVQSEPSEPEPTEPEPTEPSEPASGVSVTVGGERWWGGFTAELQLHNPGSADLDEWQFMFRSTHTIAGAWGAAIEATDFGGGLYEYRVSGSGWASSIPAGGSVTVGFNGQQGTPIGNSGPLSEAMLFE